MIIDNNDYKAAIDAFYNEDFDENTIKDISKLTEEFTDNSFIIYKIMLWKIGRLPNNNDDVKQLERIVEGIKDIYSEIDSIKTKEMTDNIKTLLKELLSINGIQLPVASTILHFYYPSFFPIIDRRALREIVDERSDAFDKNLKKYIDIIEEKCFNRKKGKFKIPTNKTDDLIEIYQSYIYLCDYLSKKMSCDYKDIDKALYKFDKIRCKKEKLGLEDCRKK